MGLERPVGAPGTAGGTTAPVVALYVALWSAVHGDPVQPLPTPVSPPPPDFGL